MGVLGMPTGDREENCGDGVTAASAGGWACGCTNGDADADADADAAAAAAGCLMSGLGVAVAVAVAVAAAVFAALTVCPVFCFRASRITSLLMGPEIVAKRFRRSSMLRISVVPAIGPLTELRDETEDIIPPVRAVEPDGV